MHHRHAPGSAHISTSSCTYRSSHRPRLLGAHDAARRQIANTSAHVCGARPQASNPPSGCCGYGCSGSYARLELAGGWAWGFALGRVERGNSTTRAWRQLRRLPWRSLHPPVQ
eukprot:scaffold18648_cov124-Isochrysis_galbana.AAC.9